MAYTYYLDFTSHLPQKLAPSRNELIRFLNQEVYDLPKGNILIQEKPGIFKVKVYDKVKGEALENRTINYILPDDITGKKPIKIKFEKRESSKYIKPRYVTVTNLHNSNLGDHITNEQLNTFFSSFGDIINPISDVFEAEESVWRLDKKRLFIDLNKGVDIPRMNPFEMKDDDGKPIRGQIRVTYREQPYHCKECGVMHTANCPIWEEKKKRGAMIKNLKAENTNTLIIGDSNLKLVNSDAILADVISSSGAKVGHINNIIRTENLDNYENIVVMAGINNIPSAQSSFEENNVFDKTKEEMHELGEILEPHIKKGKNIVLVNVPDPPHCRQSQKSVQLRNRINKLQGEMAKRLNSKSPRKEAHVHVLPWDEPPSEEDYTSIKGISDKLTADLVGKIDSLLKNKLRAPYLIGTSYTAKAYKNVTPVYPFGCNRCTKLYHTEGECEVDFSKKGRNLSNKSDNEPVVKR